MVVVRSRDYVAFRNAPEPSLPSEPQCGQLSFMTKVFRMAPFKARPPQSFLSVLEIG